MSTKLIEDYLAWDPNPATKEELRNLIASNSITPSVMELFEKRIAFGTAGLRGAMGLGYSRMNELVILQTVQGLVRYIQNQFGNELASKMGVVIGFDHRKYLNHTSINFARISAAVLIQAGIKVYMLENQIATPFVAFGVTHLKCAAGIMVTASHNPKRDNGFKVYWANGSQIIPPHDNGKDYLFGCNVIMCRLNLLFVVYI